jgi:hypothetical protein
VWCKNGWGIFVFKLKCPLNNGPLAAGARMRHFVSVSSNQGSPRYAKTLRRRPASDTTAAAHLLDNDRGLIVDISAVFDLRHRDKRGFIAAENGLHWYADLSPRPWSLGKPVPGSLVPGFSCSKVRQPSTAPAIFPLPVPLSPTLVFFAPGFCLVSIQVPPRLPARALSRRLGQPSHSPSNQRRATYHPAGGADL